jgi:hypothetical protein
LIDKRQKALSFLNAAPSHVLGVYYHRKRRSYVLAFTRWLALNTPREGYPNRRVEPEHKKGGPWGIITKLL